MKSARPLPEYLSRRYHGWKATSYAETRSWYRRLAEGGQHPRAMVISSSGKPPLSRLPMTRAL